MPSPVRFGLVAALAIACHGASAQTVVPPTLTVQRIAPQLVAFAGSQGNFQNLVTGLAQGSAVQLVTLLPDGFTQIVTFTPAAALPADQIAQALETARQRLIGLGISSPTAEQLAIGLMGGVVPTALGGSRVAGVLAPQNPPSPAVQVQSNAAAGATTSTSPIPSSTSTTTPPVNVQLVPGTTQNTTTTTTANPPRINTSDSLTPAGATSRSPVPAAPATPGTAVPATPARESATGAPQPAPQPATPNLGSRTAR